MGNDHSTAVAEEVLGLARRVQGSRVAEQALRSMALALATAPCDSARTGRNRHSGDRTPWLMEGGKGSLPRAVHFQLGPDPLAH
jgi:hypothetical protein